MPKAPWEILGHLQKPMVFDGFLGVLCFFLGFSMVFLWVPTTFSEGIENLLKTPPVPTFLVRRYLDPGLRFIAIENR